MMTLLFDESKLVVVSDTLYDNCLVTDRSKVSIGFEIFQIHCKYPSTELYFAALQASKLLLSAAVLPPIRIKPPS